MVKTLLALGVLWLAAIPAVTSSASSQCHCLPGDDCWPSKATWNQLNSTVEGRLVATVPIGHPCHDPTYDEVACLTLQNTWNQTETHLNSSSSVMQPFPSNNSCSPFTPRSSPCLLGNYVSYAVNVSNNEDVVAAVKFAKANNVRFVVRNTGHDYFGRSTGAGALAAWTHYLKSTEIVQYKSKHYTGPALKAGAGVAGGAAVRFAQSHGYVVITGDCATVGMAGGFSQGGGHSTLSTSFGLAADQALEYEVVTTDGRVVTASPEENPDLYWALSGGGGGTYGIVTSVVVRVHPDAQTGGAGLELPITATTADKFDEAVSRFIGLLPNMTDAGASVVYQLTSAMFLVHPITVYNATGDYVRDVVLAPWQKVLDILGIHVDIAYTTFPRYLDHYSTYFGPLPGGLFPVESNSFGSRLIPRSLLETSEDFQQVQKKIVAAGASALSSVASYVQHPGHPDNAVLPAWRNTTVHVEITYPWNERDWPASIADQDKISSTLDPMLEKITPGSGNYVNEASIGQDSWQQNFFGDNYDKLLEIKKKWDSDGLLYGLKLVGSEDWEVHEDGRMCRTRARVDTTID